MILLSLSFIAVGIAFMALSPPRFAEERSSSWWMGLGLAGGGFMIFLAFFAERYIPYLVWSSIFAIIIGIMTLLLDRDERGNQAPTIWVSVSLLGINALFWFFGVIATNAFIVLLFLLSIIWIAGFCIFSVRARPGTFARIGLSVAILGIVFSGLIYTHVLRSDLQYLNEITLPNYNEQVRDIQRQHRSYSQARSQSDRCLEVIDEEFSIDENSGQNYTDIAKRYQADALKNYETVTSLLDGVSIQSPYSTYTQSNEESIKKKLVTIRDARHTIDRSLSNLKEVCSELTSLSSSWKKTILWTSIEDYYSSEALDFPDGKACYYGELLTVSKSTYGEENGSLVQNKQQTDETVIDDHGDPNADFQDENWKVFDKDTYNQMVSDHWISPMGSNDPSVNDIANYLCGEKGILPEGSTFVKYEGTNTVELEDEENVYVGDYQYGSWCTQNPDGSWNSLPEEQNPPANASWCWYQPRGHSTAYYYIRVYRGNTYSYIPGPRRCYYCTPQKSWGGREFVPADDISKVNNTEKTSYRRPSDLGGGPQHGK